MFLWGQEQGGGTVVPYTVSQKVSLFVFRLIYIILIIYIIFFLIICIIFFLRVDMLRLLLPVLLVIITGPSSCPMVLLSN